MRPFCGFSEGVEKIPSQFFTEILPHLDDLSDTKVILFAFYLLNQFEGSQRYFTLSDFLEIPDFAETLHSEAILQCLECAVERSIFLCVAYSDTPLYFLNSPKGRAAIVALENGQWEPDAYLHLSEKNNLNRPNIFQLYEENIGPLTPLIADILRDCEQTYSSEWIRDAIESAIVNNARNWRYVDAVLKNRKEKGRDREFYP